MSLTTALNIAQNALLTTSKRTSVVAQNITNANTPDYSRRTAVLSSTDGGVRVSEVRRAASDSLFRQNMTAASAWQGQQRLLAGLDDLSMSVNGVGNASSPATAIGNLHEALQLYSATPSSANLAEGAADAARQLVRSLNEGSNQIQAFRTGADVEIKTAVADLNKLLADFETVNKSVIAATSTGRDATSFMDQRDAILSEIGKYMPISTYTRTNSDMVIVTGEGVTLFETVPRQVSFEPTASYGPGVVGNPVYVDGVPVTAASDPASEISGSLAALVKLRDDVAVTMQGQMDEIARGAIAAFAETDRSGGGAPALAGLFTWEGGPSLPPDGFMTPGLAATIRFNPAFDSAAGGNPVLLRDGGANGAAYVANTSGASFADLLIGYSERLEAPLVFDEAADLATDVGVSEFSANAIGWIEGLRKQASSAELSTNALMVRTAEALSNETGVNVDTEMSLLLDLEHAYEASARIISTVDQMMATLLELA
jgi:flagellar hook-associated protein 1 FlgK